MRFAEDLKAPIAILISGLVNLRMRRELRENNTSQSTSRWEQLSRTTLNLNRSRPLGQERGHSTKAARRILSKNLNRTKVMTALIAVIRERRLLTEAKRVSKMTRSLVKTILNHNRRMLGRHHTPRQAGRDLAFT